MLRRALQRTRVFQQLCELCAAQRAVRVAQHRHALRVKRAAVRARLQLELTRERQHALHARMQLVASAARVRQMRLTLEAVRARRALLRRVAQRHGMSLPQHSARDEEEEGEGEGEVEEEGDTQRALKARLIEGAQMRLRAMGSVTGGVAGAQVRGALRADVRDVRLTERDDEVAMSAELVAKLASDAGLARHELLALLRSVQRRATAADDEATGGEGEAEVEREEDVALMEAVLQQFARVQCDHNNGSERHVDDEMRAQ